MTYVDRVFVLLLGLLTVAVAGCASAPAQTIKEKTNLCTDPATYPRPVFDQSDLSAEQIASMFKNPADASELLNNLKLVVDQDLLVQPAFFDDAVLLKLFGASEIAWENPLTRAPGDPIEYGPWRIANIKSMHGGLSTATARVTVARRCVTWREPFPPFAYWPPITSNRGTMVVNVSSVDDIYVGAVKKVFGANPYESTYFSETEFDGAVTRSQPGALLYEYREKELASFSKHFVRFIPQQNRRERPQVSDSRRIYSDATRINSIDIQQDERDPSPHMPCQPCPE